MRKLELQKLTISAHNKNMTGKGKTTEACLAEIITRLGGTYTPSSSGTQGGFDGIAIFKLGKIDYLWKFESKSNKEEYKKRINGDKKQLENIKLGDFAEKIIDILSQDKEKWPIVFCLFSPHRIKDAQMLDKTRSLERNYRIPFKILFWDYDYLKEKIPYLLSKESLNFLYPRFFKSKREERSIINGCLGDINQKSLEGISISNRYISIQNQSIFYEQVIINVKKGQQQNKKGYIFEYLGNTTELVELKEVENCCLRKIPMTKTILPHKSTVNSPIYLESETTSTPVNNSIEVTVESIDSIKFCAQIAEKKDRSIKLMQDKIVFNNNISAYNLIREKGQNARGSILVIINPEEKDDSLINLPFRFLDKNDFATNIDLSFIIKND